MKKMLDYLMERPEKGLLGYQQHGAFGVTVQYWRSFEHLEAFAQRQGRSTSRGVAQVLEAGRQVGRTGIWHETFLVKAGQYEAIYGNMPPIGLGKAGRLVTVAEAKGARSGSAQGSAADHVERRERSLSIGLPVGSSTYHTPP